MNTSKGTSKDIITHQRNTSRPTTAVTMNLPVAISGTHFLQKDSNITTVRHDQ